jgi:hypothetical protein
LAPSPLSIPSLLETVQGESHVRVAVALVVGLGAVVGVRELQHGLRRVGLHREEDVGGRAEVHLADLLHPDVV